MNYHVYKETNNEELAFLYIHSYATKEQAQEYAKRVDGIISSRKFYNHVTRIL